MTTLENRSTEVAERPTVDPVTARWLPLQRGAVAVIVLASLFIQVVMASAIIPPLVVMMGLFLAAGAASLRRPRGGAMAIGVLGLLAVLAFLPDITRDMANPESAFTFVVTGTITVAALVAVVGGVQIRRRRDTPAPTIVSGIGLAVVGLILVIGVASRLTLESDSIQPGDLQVLADDFWFVPDELRAEPGTVAIHVENRDLGHHNLTIEELDVQLELPERASRRVEFDAPAGTYEAVCTLPGHERMSIDLIVS